MKRLFKASLLTLLVGAPGALFVGRAGEGPAKADSAAKPYPLDFCVVSGEKFASSKMKPYEFAYQGQAIKLCCSSCLDDFKKEPAKFLKQVQETKPAGK